jgi:hypothetical protein
MALNMCQLMEAGGGGGGTSWGGNVTVCVRQYFINRVNTVSSHEISRHFKCLVQRRLVPFTSSIIFGQSNLGPYLVSTLPAIYRGPIHSP